MGNIGERIRLIRRQFGLTQEDLGKLLGIKKGAVSKFECDRAIPTEAALKLICATYHINYLWLTEGLGDMLEEETTDDMIERLMAGESPLAIQIIKAFAKLPQEEWERLSAIMDAVEQKRPLF